MAANPTQRMLQRLCTKLPKEVLDTILSYPELGRADLHAVLFVNSVFHDLALRHLYRSIVANLSIEPAHGPTLSPARCIALLHTLCRSPALGALVRELQLDWSQHQPTGTLFRLLNRALRALPNLSVLALEVSSAAGRFSLAWVFDGCRGALTSFTTSARCDGALARFLATQPLLEEVCLRGFRAHDPFALPPGALPRLRAFRAIHAGPAVFAEVVRGRPVEAITLSLFTEDGLATLAVLAQSARPLRKLTIMSLDCTDPALMLAEVARTSPELESLHIVILFGRYETRTRLKEALEGAAPVLARFKSLRYLTFMAGGVPSGSEDEATIATRWAAACPTLRTIILPQGNVWFEKDSTWITVG